jgi:hypothetical protein
MQVHTPDIWSDRVGREEHRLLDIEENTGPITLSREQAVEKVRRLLLDRFGLPEKPLYLDTTPEFNLAPDPSESLPSADGSKPHTDIPKRRVPPSPLIHPASIVQ